MKDALEQTAFCVEFSADRPKPTLKTVLQFAARTIARFSFIIVANRESKSFRAMAEKEQRRRSPRVKAPKGMVVAWQTGTQRSVSYLESLALGGLFIRTKHPPPVRSLVVLLMDLPLGGVRARAIVRRITPSKGMGVEFIAMSPEDRARLSHVLRPLLTG